MISEEIVTVKKIYKVSYCLNTQQKRLVVVRQSKRLYSKNLREDLYLLQLAKTHTATVSSESHNFLAIKRYHHKMRFYGLYNIQRFFFRENPTIFPDIIRENTLIHSEMIILLIPLALRKNISTQNRFQTFVKSNIFSSFHSAFMHFEHKWENVSYALEGEMPSYLHPEMLVRILGFRFKDVAFIDLLRRILYTNSIKLSHPSDHIKHGMSKHLTTILWNLWTLEFEDFLTSEFFSLLYKSIKSYRNNVSFLRKLRFFNLQDFQKQMNINNNLWETIQNFSSKMHSEMFCAKTCNYLRYANSWIIGIEADMLVIQALKRRCIRFWRRRIGIFVKSSRLDLINLYKDHTWFLGSVLKFKYDEMRVQLMKANNLVLPRTGLKQKRLVLMIPIVSLVKLLSKYGFCQSNGYPISKSSWSTWPDSKIIERFNQILISISCHYSGCANKKTLAHIQYLLSYSCGKTLACKHKTNLRSIWYNYADELARNYLSSKMVDTLTLGFITKINNIFIKQKRLAIWDLNDVDPDPMVLFFIDKAHKK
jgi:hypothetical protein